MQAFLPLLVVLAGVFLFLGGIFYLSRTLMDGLRQISKDLQAAAREASDTLADTRSGAEREWIDNVTHRLASVEDLAARLPGTWEDWYEKINAAAARRERAAQRAEKAAEERFNAEGEDAEFEGVAPSMADGSPDGVRAVPGEMGQGESDADSRRAAIRAAHRRIKYGV